MKKETKYKEMTFDELVDQVATRLMLSLFEGGWTAFRTEVNLRLSQAIAWSKENKNK